MSSFYEEILLLYNQKYLSYNQLKKKFFLEYETRSLCQNNDNNKATLLQIKMRSIMIIL